MHSPVLHRAVLNNSVLHTAVRMAVHCSALTRAPQLCPINQHSESLLVAMQRRAAVHHSIGAAHQHSSKVQLCTTVLLEYSVLVVATFYLLRWRIFTTLNTLYSRVDTTVYLVYWRQHPVLLPTSPYLCCIKYRHDAFCATANILFMAATAPHCMEARVAWCNVVTHGVMWLFMTL